MSEELNKASDLVKLSYETKTEPGGQSIEQLPSLWYLAKTLGATYAGQLREPIDEYDVVDSGNVQS
jgi:hypothetical protein